MEAEQQETGELLRDFGMQSVLSNTPEAWRDNYVRLAGEWFNGLSVGTVVLGEDIRHAIEPVLGAAPHHINAWSAAAASAIRGWKKDRRLRDHGSTTAKQKAARARLVRQYLKVKD